MALFFHFSSREWRCVSSSLSLSTQAVHTSQVTHAKAILRAESEAAASPNRPPLPPPDPRDDPVQRPRPQPPPFRGRAPPSFPLPARSLTLTAVACVCTRPNEQQNTHTRATGNTNKTSRRRPDHTCAPTTKASAAQPLATMATSTIVKTGAPIAAVTFCRLECDHKELFQAEYKRCVRMRACISLVLVCSVLTECMLFFLLTCFTGATAQRASRFYGTPPRLFISYVCCLLIL